MSRKLNSKTVKRKTSARMPAKGEFKDKSEKEGETVAPEKSRLVKILNRLPATDQPLLTRSQESDLEEKMVLSWKNRAQIDRNNLLAQAAGYARKPKGKLRQVLSADINDFSQLALSYRNPIYAVGAKTALAKKMTTEKLADKPWALKLATVILMVMIISVSFVKTAPAGLIARWLDRADIIITSPFYPVSGDSLDRLYAFFWGSRNMAGQFAPAAYSEPLPTKNILSGFIIKHAKDLPSIFSNHSNTAIIEKEKITGQVAGAEESGEAKVLLDGQNDVVGSIIIDARKLIENLRRPFIRGFR